MQVSNPPPELQSGTHNSQRQHNMGDWGGGRWDMPSLVKPTLVNSCLAA